MSAQSDQEIQRQEWVIESMQIVSSPDTGLPRLVTLFLALDEDHAAEYVARFQLELLGTIRKLRRRKRKHPAGAALPRGGTSNLNPSNS